MRNPRRQSPRTAAKKPVSRFGVLHHFRSNKRRTRGDTIIEVLIAIAIVGAVLSGAFTVSQKSSLAVRNSQEHGEMLQLLQGQVELVRARAMEASGPTAGVYSTSPKYFCINADTKQRQDQPQLPTTLPEIDTDDFSTYEAACKFGTEDRYNVAVSYNQSTNIFTFVGRWDRLGGGKNQELLSYRMHPKQVIVPPALPPNPTPPPSNPGGGVINQCVLVPGSCTVQRVYIWSGNYVNFAAQLPGVTVETCTWRFTNPKSPDDVITGRACNPGDTLYHAWPQFTVRPFPQDCGVYWTYITLSTTYSDGTTRTFSYDPSGGPAFNMPDCDAGSY